MRWFNSGTYGGRRNLSGDQLAERGALHVDAGIAELQYTGNKIRLGKIGLVMLAGAKKGRVNLGGLIVHEWISKRGGSENVLDAMFSAFPESDIRCLWNDTDGRFPKDRLQESWLARTPLRRSKIASLPFMPATWRGMRLAKKYEWMLVSSHLFAHHATLDPPNVDIKKYSYVHTPARYIWTPELDSRGSGIIPRLVSPMFRALDRRRAGAHTNVAANSNFVRSRIHEFWNVDARVIYPPVDVDRIQQHRDWTNKLIGPEADYMKKLPGQFILGASRFVPYKRLDTVLQLASVTRESVVLAGSGPDEARLRHLAVELGVDATFIVNPSDALLFSLYQRAIALVFPAVEDFGIMPVEAMAAGTPVLVNRIGGAAESVVDGKTGIHFDVSDLRSAAIGLERAQSLSSAHCEQRAKEFSNRVFETNLQNWMGV